MNFAVVLALWATVTPSSTRAQDCNWCGMQDAPENPPWSIQIASEDESGERLVVTGTVYEEDGSTPAEGVLIYVYHTNDEGVYPKRGDEQDNARYHGYLRGWMRTDAQGRYRFETTRPAPYHTHGGEPAHIHYTVQAPGREEYWLNAAWFSDDPRVNAEYLAGLERVGGFTNVIDVSQDASDTWHGRRDIILATYD